MAEEPPHFQVRVLWAGESLDQGLPAAGLVLPGPSVHFLKCPGSGAVGSVQRTPRGPREDTASVELLAWSLSCLFRLLEQVQEGGLAHSQYIFLSHQITPLRTVSPAGRSPSLP